MKGYQFVTISSLLLAVGSVAYSAGRSVQAPAVTPQPVQVTNTSSQCVPTSIYHSINLPAVQAGAWNVGLSEDKDPYEHYNQLSIPNTGTYTTDSFQVPAGKRLIIQSLSGGSIPTGTGNYATFGLIQVLIPGQGNIIRDELYFPFGVGLLPGRSTFNAQTHLIAEPGDLVYLFFYRSANNTSLDTEIDYSLEGYMVAVP